MNSSIDTNKYQVWLKDTDPDTGAMSTCVLMAIATSEVFAEWIKESLYKNNGEDPNRDFYITTGLQ